MLNACPQASPAQDEPIGLTPERVPIPRPTADAAPLDDLRFRQLLGRADWDALPPAVRNRFGKRVRPGEAVNYIGRVLSCRISAFGWVLVQLCRAIGAPLPLDQGGGGAAAVSVTEDSSSGGQIWTRLYARSRGFPQVIHSAKRFAGPTGLEEYLAAGLGIALRVRPVAKGLRFVSDHYFLRIGRLRLRWPRWLTPGTLTIEHLDEGCGTFVFTLALHHRLLGELVVQRSRFSDQHSLEVSDD